MRVSRNTLIIGLLVLVGGFLKGPHANTSRVPLQGKPVGISLPAAGQCNHFIPLFAQSQPSDHTRHGEKRHGKSLINEAVIVDCPTIIRPGFTYCQRNYTLFLPGGCTRQFTGNFSLRGPPSAC
jgi:hypothetical protein